MTSYYPGSKQKPKTFETPSEPISVDIYLEFLSSPRKATLFGKEINFYTVGELARALNRKPVTIRKWEADGVIPKATFIAPSSDKRGKRRLYTEDQIAGLVRIAKEEGLLEPNAHGAWKAVGKTQFREKALKLFKELAENK